ncbi:helix-turn-helix domain-containing protein [Photobacterium sp. 1_MG-2023]|uniref:helix-turn-helix domain-containing protein n=1 Tax=Photobacterium sp. 1_MG-2023 TaxID=3062646 RepID=UPI0026E2E8BD|nr:helix-turn-helix transcriptional regulator [Photobacterium sp. 1_MG-2023]MDO6708984.1 helix-turn-helix transcriptional regulator [Photobacterium sp. 1_MG-2023]
MASAQRWNSQMTPEDKQLYKELGQRIAQTRKALGLTQTQVAEQLGISQQTLAHYEVGRLRIAVSTLVPLAESLHSSVDELLYSQEAAKGSNKRGPASKLQQQIEQVRQQPIAKQQFLMEMLDTVIQQAAH